MLRRNEIFEMGQCVGLPQSGNLDDGFNTVGTIVDGIIKPNVRSGYFNVRVMTLTGRSVMWSFFKTAPYELYEGEIPYVYEKK